MIDENIVTKQFNRKVATKKQTQTQQLTNIWVENILMNKEMYLQVHPSTVDTRTERVKKKKNEAPYVLLVLKKINNN